MASKKRKKTKKPNQAQKSTQKRLNAIWLELKAIRNDDNAAEIKRKALRKDIDWLIAHKRSMSS